MRHRIKPAYASIGDHAVLDACTALDVACQKAVAIMVEWPHTMPETGYMMFRDEDVAKLRAARQLMTPASEWGRYDVAPDARLELGFENSGIAPPIAEAYQITDRTRPLLEMVEKVRAIYTQYEECKALVRWLNKNATPGAVRYYFPGVLALLSGSHGHGVPQELPSRHTTPPEIHNMLPVIRDASTLVAAMQMLPSDARMRFARPTQTMNLTFYPTILSSEGFHYGESNTVTFAI